MLRVGGEMREKIARSWGRHSFSGKLLRELVDCAGLQNLANGSSGRIPHQRHRHCSRSDVRQLALAHCDLSGVVGIHPLRSEQGTLFPSCPGGER